MVIIIITSVVVSFALGFVARYVIAKIRLNSTEIKAQKLLQNAREEAILEKKTLLSEGMLEVEKDRKRLEAEIREKKSDVQKLENRLLQREASIDKKNQYLENKEHEIEKKFLKVKEQKENLDVLIAKQQKELESISSLTKEEAKSILMTSMESEAKKASSKTIDNIEKNAIETGEKKAREILVQVVQRISSSARDRKSSLK